MEEQKEEIKEVNGVKYYEIKLNAKEEGVDDLTLRLFETASAKRLEFETYEEYQVRRQYLKQMEKSVKRGQVAWPSRQLGTLTPQRAMQVMEQINKQQEEQLKKQENE